MTQAERENRQEVVLYFGVKWGLDRRAKVVYTFVSSNKNRQVKIIARIIEDNKRYDLIDILYCFYFSRK